MSLDPDTGREPALSGSGAALLDAVVAIGSDLDLHAVLERIVRSACALTGARYGALGVLGPAGDLGDFITHGLTSDERARIGPLPRGRGILGLLIAQPDPLRLTELSSHPDSVGFPANHPPMSSFLGVPVRIRGTVFGNLYLTEKEGGHPFSVQDEQLVQALARAAGFVIENARSYESSERQRHWLESTARLTAALQPPMDLDRARGQVAIAARRGLGGDDTVAVVVLGDDVLELAASDGRELALLEETMQVMDGPVRRAIESGAVSSQVHRERSVLIAPLPTHLNAPAALVAIPAHRAQEAYATLEMREMLAAFGTQAALALDRIQALSDREELALVSDRDRIARDLHDVVIQRLFATGLQLQSLHQRVETTQLRRLLDRAVTDLDETILDIRSTIFGLQRARPGRLLAEVRALTSEYSEALGFAPVVRSDGPVDTVVDGPTAEALLAVLREALSNVARHAGAGSARIEVSVEGHDVVLTVRDDGGGLPDERDESGLANVRRRATDLGGRCEVRAAAGGGTLLSWRVPLS